MGVASTAELDTGTPGGVAEIELCWEQLEALDKSALPIAWVVKAVGSRPKHDCMDQMLSSMGCVGLVSDCRVCDMHEMITIPFAAFEHEAQISLWCTDRSPAKKRADLRQLIENNAEPRCLSSQIL